jgi:hypothetical protein
MQTAKKGTTLAIYATPIAESVKGPEALPTLKTNLLPFGTTLMKILPRISFNIPSL